MKNQLAGFWQYLHERMDFNPLEYPLHRIGIGVSEPLCLFLGFKIQDQQASGLIGQRSGQNNPPLFVQWFQVG